MLRDRHEDQQVGPELILQWVRLSLIKPPRVLTVTHRLLPSPVDRVFSCAATGGRSLPSWSWGPIPSPALAVPAQAALGPACTPARQHGIMEAVGRQPVVDPELGPASWSRRYKENVERLRSGDRGRITEVVRQLSGRERAMGISEGERRMLARARQMLDDPGSGTAGVREPRLPLPPDDAMSVASESDPNRASGRVTN
jgi:hypothetical protein